MEITNGIDYKFPRPTTACMCNIYVYHIEAFMFKQEVDLLSFGAKIKGRLTKAM